MSESRDSLELLGELCEALERAPDDVEALARERGIEEREARDVARALAALRESTGEDLPQDLPRELPDPELPADYEIQEEIGRGGMGVVYRARQRSLDRTVAIKVLRPGELLFSEAIARFQNEAKSLARLKHRHIVSIHEVGELGGNVYYSMDLIEGGSLADHLRRDPWTPARTVRLLRQVTSAIAYTHGHDLIHRDLKPQNILVDEDGDAYVVDFGLARDCAVEGDLTVSGHILGTPDYMSPEQAQGQTDRIGEATDIYALGAILYECLTGTAPFAGLPLVEKIHAVVHTDPEPVRRKNPRVPVDLETICSKCMAKEPERRYATARALLEDLERFEDGRPIRGKKASPLYRANRFVKNNLAAVVAVSIVTAVFAIAQFVFIQPHVGDTPASKLAAARSLEEAGVTNGAILRYAEGVALAEERGDTGEVARELRRRLAYANLSAAREHFEGGDEEASKAELDRALEQLEVVVESGLRELRAGQFIEDPGLAMDQALLLALKGEFEVAREAIARSSLPVGSGSEPGYRRLTELLAPTLLHADHAGHSIAVEMLFGESIVPIPLVRFLEPDGRGLEVLSEALLGLDRLPAEKARFLLSSLEGELERLESAFGRRLCEAYAAVAFSPDVENGDLARFAANQFASVAELPFSMRREWDAALAREHLGRYATGAAPDGDRIAEFVEHLANDDDFFLAVQKDRWIFEAIGRPDLARGGPAEWAELNLWWQENRKRTPAQWMTDALGLELSDLDDPDGLIERFLEARGPRRKQLHHLLTFLVFGREQAPVWPTARRREPEWLAHEWTELLTSEGRARRAPHRLRLAQLQFRLDGAVDFLWEQSRVIGFGERFGIGQYVQRLGDSAPRPGMMLDALRSRRDWALPASGVTSGVDLVADLRWRRAEFGMFYGGGIVDGEAGQRPRQVPLSFRGRSENFLRPEVVTPIATLERKDSTETCVLLAFLEPQDRSDGSAWGLSGWCEALSADLETLFEDVAREGYRLREPDEPETSRGSRTCERQARTLWLASLLPDPAHRNALREHERVLRALIEAHEQGRSADFLASWYRGPSVYLAAARLALDDAEAIRSMEGGFELFDMSWMARRLVHSRDASIREHLAEELSDRLSTPAWVRVGQAARKAGVSLPVAARERVRAESRRTLTAGIENSVPGYFALGLLIGLVGAALFRLRARREGPAVQALSRIPLLCWICSTAVVQVGLSSYALASLAWLIGGAAAWQLGRMTERRTSASMFLVASALASVVAEAGAAIGFLLAQVFFALALFGLASLHERLSAEARRRTFFVSAWPRHIARFVVVPGILVGVASQFWLSLPGSEEPVNGELPLDVFVTVHLGAEILAAGFLLALALAGHAHASTRPRVRITVRAHEPAAA